MGLSEVDMREKKLGKVKSYNFVIKSKSKFRTVYKIWASGKNFFFQKYAKIWFNIKKCRMSFLKIAATDFLLKKYGSRVLKSTFRIDRSQIDRLGSVEQCFSALQTKKIRAKFYHVLFDCWRSLRTISLTMLPWCMLMVSIWTFWKMNKLLLQVNIPNC